RPRELLRSEVLGDLDRKDTPLAARQEVRRLSHIGTAWLDAIVGSRRKVEFLLRVAIEVSEQQTDAAVLVVEPALVRAGDPRPALADRVGQRKRRRRLPGALLAVNERTGGQGARAHRAGEEPFHMLES